MNFRASFCHPLQKDIIEYGVISKEDILKKFEEISWKEYLAAMKNVDESEIHFSPSFEIENIKNRNGLTISALDNGEWYIFFKRPKLVKYFFGLSSKMDDEYISDSKEQNEKDVRKCVEALLNNDLKFLEEKIK